MNHALHQSQLTWVEPTAAQRQLAEAHVFVSSALGVGGTVLTQLAAAGVGHLKLAEGGGVEASDLAGQTVYERGDLGRLRAVALRDHLRRLNPECTTHLFVGRVTPDHLAEVLAEQQIVVAPDPDPETLALLAERCQAQGIPLICGEAGAIGGRVWRAQPGAEFAGPEVQAAAGSPEADALLTAPTVGVIAALVAAEVLKVLLGTPGDLGEDVLSYEAVTGQVTRTARHGGR
jgi:adenylyltransferase/sulfurtransferase